MDNAHSTLKSKGGLSEPVVESADIFEIPSDSPFAPESRKQITLSMQEIGKLERIAKSDFYFSKIIGNLNASPNRVRKSEEHFFSDGDKYAIAHSVRASSEIEGEKYTAKEIEIAIASPSIHKESTTREFGDRMAVLNDQIETYIWLLNSHPEQPISVELIKEIHTRMFKNHPSIGTRSGAFKTEEVHLNYVSGGKKRVIQTVPAAKTYEYMEILCDEYNRNFLNSRDHAQYSQLILAGLFQLDYLAIHPFPDGNGRTGRLLSTYLLHRSGFRFSYLYPLDQVILESKAKYYASLFVSQSKWHTEAEDVSTWLSYYIRSVFTQFERALSAVRDSQ
jgi:Fic family protein